MSAPKRLEIKEIDNRDEVTTWLWIDDGHYIEVNPRELLHNAHENNPNPVCNMEGEPYAPQGTWTCPDDKIEEVLKKFDEILEDETLHFDYEYFATPEEEE